MEQVIGLLGRAIGICEYLRRVPFGLRNNKFLVPSDILMKYNLQPRSIWDRTRGKPSESLFDAVL
jgi:NADH dehydrogenase [ubiquinone] 1 alpha subcomplex assembly factor 6